MAKTASEMAAYRQSIKMAKNQMPGPAAQEEKKPEVKQKETQEQVARRILDSRGNVKEIVNGQKYSIYFIDDGKEEFLDRYDAATTRDLLEDYKYNEETGTWKSRFARQYRIKLVKKKN